MFARRHRCRYCCWCRFKTLYRDEAAVVNVWRSGAQMSAIPTALAPSRIMFYKTRQQQSPTGERTACGAQLKLQCAAETRRCGTVQNVPPLVPDGSRGRVNMSSLWHRGESFAGTPHARSTRRRGRGWSVNFGSRGSTLFITVQRQRTC